MKHALVLVLALAVGPSLAGAAQAQVAAGGGATMRLGASPAWRGDHRRGDRHRRPDPVARWERGLEQARARGNITGRDPWSSYQRMPAASFARSHFPQSRLPGSQLWPGACWGWRSDCDEGGGVAASFASGGVSAPALAAPAASSAPRPFARPAVRQLDARPVVRGSDAAAPAAYAHHVWRR